MNLCLVCLFIVFLHNNAASQIEYVNDILYYDFLCVILSIKVLYSFKVEHFSWISSYYFIKIHRWRFLSKMQHRNISTWQWPDKLHPLFSRDILIVHGTDLVYIVRSRVIPRLCRESNVQILSTWNLSK